ncbi:hypothetical protein FN846DRAFT_480149 [Sphaerosporella brunnea]|uniref:DUF6697 domain-containing protein n=1 Tax=Sphaerosporella brunnea TaxID=1250544 RepID=A0A5J5FC73_9PEZI|nr:hypothetical protein FN846DRAFT_480149 [Sphaerosporella brunnea]
MPRLTYPSASPSSDKDYHDSYSTITKSEEDNEVTEDDDVQREDKPGRVAIEDEDNIDAALAFEIGARIGGLGIRSRRIARPVTDDPIGADTSRRTNTRRRRQEASDSDSASPQKKRRKQTPKLRKKPVRRKKGDPPPPKTVFDLDSGDEDTLRPYRPAAPSPPQPQGTVKAEAPESDDDDLYSVPTAAPATKTASPEVMIVPGPAWKPNTGWNDEIFNSATPERKPYAHELIELWEPYQFPDRILPDPLRYPRKFLSNVLGGPMQAVTCSISVDKALQNNHRLDRYYCVRGDWNPHMPIKPGAHGIRYFHRPGYADHTDTWYPLFCRRGTDMWEYCGEYVIEMRPFIDGEWKRLSPETKQLWAVGLATKNWGREFLMANGYIKEGEFHTITSKETMQMIDTGIFCMESHIYRCVGYNWVLHDWLEKRWQSWEGRKDWESRVGVKEESAEGDEVVP